MDRTEWLAALRKHLNSRRRKAPIPEREALSPRDAWEYRVLGGHLLRWLDEWGPEMLAERAVVGGLADLDDMPVVCIVTSVPGLVAAREILGRSNPNVVWGLREDFDSFAQPDPEFHVHAELRTWFEDLGYEGRAAKARDDHPIRDDMRYRVHHDESVMGPLFARGGRHLWVWDGADLHLLEEAFETWVS